MALPICSAASVPGVRSLGLVERREHGGGDAAGPQRAQLGAVVEVVLGRAVVLEGGLIVIALDQHQVAVSGQLDELVDAAREASDTIAERMRALDAVPDGRSDTVAATTSLPQFPANELNTGDVVDLVAALDVRNGRHHP
jgi:hypothetical protein